MIRSQNVLNFAYTLYLKLRVQGYEPHLIEHYVRRWLVLSMLPGRYSSASETQFDYDIRQIASRDFGALLGDVEAAELSETFWTVVAPAPQYLRRQQPLSARLLGRASQR